MGETLEWDPRMGGGPLEWDGEPPRMGGDPLELGGGSRTQKLGLGLVCGTNLYTIGTNIGLYGLKLSAFILTFRDDSNGSTPEGPRPLI